MQFFTLFFLPALLVSASPIVIIPRTALPSSLSARDTPTLTPRQSVSEDLKRTATDRLLYSTPISEFQTAMASMTPAFLDWTHIDGCSTPTGSQPFGYNFEPSCQRHDFGYRNYRNQNRLCASQRVQLDNQFAKDLKRYCDKKSFLKRWHCQKTADTYVWFVAKYYDPKFSAGC